MKFRYCLIVAGLALSACGDSGRIDTGLPRSKPLNEITDAEARRACENVVDDLEIMLTREQDCTLEGLLRASTEADCEAARDECLARPEPDPPAPEDCSMSDASDFADCPATVGELEDCLDARLASNESFLRSLSCADAGGELSYPPLPEACRPIATQCPDLIDD